LTAVSRMQAGVHDDGQAIRSIIIVCSLGMIYE